MSDLDTLAELSRAFGGPDYVLGGGGNTSVKTADTLWVKPSGTQLSALTPERFVAINRQRLSALYAYVPAADAAVRENDVKDLMMAAREPGHEGRPSVETPVHDLLQFRYVVHTHPALVNGLTCARDGAAVAARLFPEALWVPYVDPGYTLSIDVRGRLATYTRQHGRQPNLILLENHGVFVGGATPESVRATYRHLLQTLRTEYQMRGIPCELKYLAPTVHDELEGLSGQLTGLLGLEGRAIVASAPFRLAEGPLTPDHMVYAKAFPYRGELTRSGLLAFSLRHGYTPRIVETSAAIVAVGRTVKAAQLALDLAQDGGLVKQLAEAFGGVRYLNEAARRFIENWEVESYREQQVASRECQPARTQRGPRASGN